MRTAPPFDKAAILNFWCDRKSRFLLQAKQAESPLGGILQVRTNASNEVTIRILHNVASLYRKDRKTYQPGRISKSAGSLVYSAKSQTNPETGEITALPRRKKFTRHARKLIREAGGALEVGYQKRVWFLTLTLPGSTQEAIKAYASADKEIKNAFLQNFRKLFNRVCHRSHERLDYLCVSELQRRGAIHLHLALGWASERFAKLVKRCYRRWWHKVLLHYSRKLGVDLCARSEGETWRHCPGKWLLECEQVEKSVGRYLAKYVSKHYSKSGFANVDTPSSWWSISGPLRAKVREHRKLAEVRFKTREQAILTARRAVETLRECGYTFAETLSAWSGELLGWVCFPEGLSRSNLFDHCSLLIEPDLNRRHWSSEFLQRFEVSEEDLSTQAIWSDTG